MEKTVQVLINEVIPLSGAQKRRLSELCQGLLLAGSSQVSQIAGWLAQATQQDSRIQWVRRVLAAPYMTQTAIYQPLFKRVLSEQQAPVYHVLMDRTCLVEHQVDLLSLNLYFRKRAVPLGWDLMSHGMSDYALQTSLIERCRPLLPQNSRIIFHGDNEFGGVRLMQYLRQYHWDFIVGQSGKNYYRQSIQSEWQRLSTLAVSKSQAVYLQAIEITKAYAYGKLNLFAFYRPRFSHRGRKQDIRYYVTSLPITPALRAIGQRRWGIECYFKDFKSAGWQLQLSHLSDLKRYEGLLTCLNFCYLWLTCLGRWLCKTSQRHLVDRKSQRHLSLFRLGHDWLVHQYRMNQPCPVLLTLYH